VEMRTREKKKKLNPANFKKVEKTALTHPIEMTLYKKEEGGTTGTRLLEGIEAFNQCR